MSTFDLSVPHGGHFYTVYMNLVEKIITTFDSFAKKIWRLFFVFLQKLETNWSLYLGQLKNILFYFSVLSTVLPKNRFVFSTFFDIFNLERFAQG